MDNKPISGLAFTGTKSHVILGHAFRLKAYASLQSLITSQRLGRDISLATSLFSIRLWPVPSMYSPPKYMVRVQEELHPSHNPIDSCLPTLLQAVSSVPLGQACLSLSSLRVDKETRLPYTPSSISSGFLRYRTKSRHFYCYKERVKVRVIISPQIVILRSPWSA